MNYGYSRLTCDGGDSSNVRQGGKVRKKLELMVPSAVRKYQSRLSRLVWEPDFYETKSLLSVVHSVFPVHIPI